MIEDFEKANGLTFKNKTLLRQAFTHRSYVNEKDESGELLADNERLEFLGDTVLQFIVSDLLYQRFPTFQEGKLTHIRTTLVRKETLAKFARELALGDYLLLGIGEEESGGRERIPTLCATYEALIGAIYIDTNDLESVRNFILPRIEVELAKTEGATKDAKSRFQEWGQETFGFTPRYRPVASIGPDHNKTFIMRVDVNGQPHGVGKGKSKGEATQAAAAMALYRNGQPSPEYILDEMLEQEYGFSPIRTTVD